MLAALASRRVVEGRGAIVVAHPDDETIAAGASLGLMPGLLLVHLTDGAPRRLGDASRAGFSDPAAYAAAREAELQAALEVGGVQPRRVRLGVPDQDVSLHLGAVRNQLDALFAAHQVDWLLTHAYEGGHPDHDGTAWAVHAAARRRSTPVFEFAGYHAAAGEMVVQRFLPGPSATVAELGEIETARKRLMLDAFRTQAGILGLFDPAVERFRRAPDYDWSQPPHAGALNYERWGWELTGKRFRTLVAEESACVH